MNPDEDFESKRLYSEVMKDLDCAKQFCKLNGITPFCVVVLWTE